MPHVTDVMTGEVAVGRAGDVLRSSAIGSCVVISAYCPKTKTGGLAHVMLPGYASSEETSQKTRYAGNAIHELLSQMNSLGADLNNLDVCLVGAGNVLKRPDDTVSKNNLDSVTEILREKNIKIKAESVGGTTRRSVTFDIGKEMLFYTEGDEAERLLWTAQEKGLKEWISQLEESRTVIRRSEKNLRESEERLRLTAQAGRVGLWEWNLMANKVYYSPDWKRQIGYEDHEITNDFREWQERVHPDDLVFTEQKIRMFIEKVMPNFVVEFRFRHKDGSYRWIMAQASLSLDNDGKPTDMRGSHIDITERKRAEEKYSMLFNAMPDACAVHEIICDDARGPVDYRFLAVNTAFEHMTGLKAENVVGRTVLEVLPNTERSWIETYGQVALSGDSVCFENYSSELQKHFHVAAFRNVPNQFVVVFTDITERKKTEEKLTRAHDLHLRLLDHAPSLIWRSGLDAKCDWFNTTWLDFTGRSLEQEKGDGWVEGVHPDDLKRCVKIYLDAFHARQSFVMEYRLRRYDGEFRWIADHGIPVHSAQGEFTGYIGYCFDITERKKTEEKLLSQMKELKVFYDASVGREERIVQLKNEVEKLKREAGK